MAMWCADFFQEPKILFFTSQWYSSPTYYCISRYLYRCHIRGRDHTVKKRAYPTGVPGPYPVAQPTAQVITRRSSVTVRLSIFVMGSGEK